MQPQMLTSRITRNLPGKPKLVVMSASDKDLLGPHVYESIIAALYRHYKTLGHDDELRKLSLLLDHKRSPDEDMRSGIILFEKKRRGA